MACDLSLLTLELKRKPTFRNFQLGVATCRVAAELGQCPGARLWVSYGHPWSKAFKEPLRFN